jgi:hypothetical protein
MKSPFLSVSSVQSVVIEFEINKTTDCTDGHGSEKWIGVICVHLILILAIILLSVSVSRAQRAVNLYLKDLEFIDSHKTEWHDGLCKNRSRMIGG